MTTLRSTVDNLVQAYLNGAAWRPESSFDNLKNLDQDRIRKMNGTESDARLLVRASKLADVNFDLLHLDEHKRLPDYDEDLGIATERLLGLPRCPIPDFPPPPHASFDYGIPDLNAAVESYRDFANYVGGSGSWPKGCDPDWPNVHSVVTFFDDRNASSSQKGVLTEALKYTEDCEAEIGQHLRHVRPPDTYAKPHHHVTFGPIPGSVIGYNYFPRPDTCNQTVQGKIDSTFGASAITLANLLTHEYKGHGDGLEHTRGGIMNPSIITINPLSWLGDPSQARKFRFFGGVPIPVGPTPSPGPTPVPTLIELILKGDLKAGSYKVYEGSGPIVPPTRPHIQL